jgi:hypothetical protein
MSRADVVRRALRTRKWPSAGRCPICGRATLFVWLDPNPREGLACPICRSAARHRLVARVLLDRWHERSLRAVRSVPEPLYIADVHGPLASGLRHVRDQISWSDLVPGVPLGDPLPGGGSCQNLEQLTFDDASFDVVITEDVLEHVRHADRAFQDIYRVLRPGGVHIFTVPFFFDRPTLTRVDTSGEEDVLLMEPEWHGDSIRGNILAYRTFGYDMFEMLSDAGFMTTARFASFTDRRHGIFDASVFVSSRAA